MKLKADMNDSDPQDAVPRELEHAPRGTYDAEITECAIVDPTNGKDRRIEVTAKITDPAGKYWPLRDYINVISEKAKFKYDQFLMAVGVLNSTNKRAATWDDAAQVGKKVKILVFPDSYTRTEPDGTTTTIATAKIGGWLPKGAKASANSKAAAETSSVDDEITLTMHGAAADNEDADSITYLEEKAAEHDLDPNDYDTWAELAEELENLEAQDEDTNTEDNTEDDVDLEALGEAGDSDDADAQAALEGLAEDVGLDPNDYATWAELAAELGKADGSQDGPEDEEVDYNSKPLNWLKKEAKERGVDATGTKAEIVELLEAFDEDPFKS